MGKGRFGDGWVWCDRALGINGLVAIVVRDITITRVITGEKGV